MTLKILYVGFTPFAAHPRNPSEQICSILRGKGKDAKVYDVAYGEASDALLKDLKGYDAAIILALSPFAKEPTLERYAYNERDSVQADNKGYVKTHEVIEPKGPASRATDIDLASLCQSLIANGYGAAMGLDPGRFVANECYYRALKAKKALLIHVPLNEDYPESESADVALLVERYLKGE